jgi:hypothetical protein
MSDAFQVTGNNDEAPFTLKVHRGDGMALLGMNWKEGDPPDDFVGFAIEYKEPDGTKFFALKNRLCFPQSDGSVNPNKLSTRLSPIQKFRWVHFPRNAELMGEFVYRVTPVFMNAQGELSYGESQDAAIELRRETFPGRLNVTFTRGFVASQAFVDRYESAGKINTLLPPDADAGLDFEPTHPKADEALAWMGFEARSAILELLDEAIADEDAQVRVVAYDLSERQVVSRLKQLGGRLKIIIDDDGSHGEPKSGETVAAARLTESAGEENVKRQHMGKLQHNKTIIVAGPKVQAVVCGSTNYSWRGFFVQNNNAVVMRGENAVAAFLAAFQNYWDNDSVTEFGKGKAAQVASIDIEGIDVQVGFAPFASKNSMLEKIAEDIETAESSVFYSLAFLAQTKGVIRDALEKVTNDEKIFVYGIADKEVGGIVLQKPDGNVAPVSPAALKKNNVPEPFSAEPTGGGGVRMHHKFVVIDFDKPTARVYFGSYNFSISADESNGENLVLIRDRRVATSYMIEALRIFDHYHFRLAQEDAEEAQTKLFLRTPPSNAGEEPWWTGDFNDPRRIRDRKLFS